MSTSNWPDWIQDGLDLYWLNVPLLGSGLTNLKM